MCSFASDSCAIHADFVERKEKEQQLLLWTEQLESELDPHDEIKAVTSCSTHKIEQKETDG